MKEEREAFIARIARERSERRLRSGCKNPEDWCGNHTCTSACPSIIRHGPGHQGKSHCGQDGPHEQHRAEICREVMYWSGMNASTGFFDESPE